MLIRFFYTCMLCILTIFAHAQTLRIATYQYADNNRIKNIQPFADLLKAKHGMDTEVKSYPTIHDMIAGIQNNEVDIAFINTFGYFLLETSEKNYPMIPGYTLAVRSDAVDNYKTAIITPAGSTLKNLEDVGKTASKSKLMLVATGSTSGNLVPRLAFSNIGLADCENDFKSVGYAGNHTLAIQSIVNQEADISAMGFTEYEKITRDPAMAAKLKLIWRSPEIPLGPVLLHNGLHDSTRSEIVKALQSLHVENKQVLESIKEGWSEAKYASHYISINDSFYDSFRKTLGKDKDLQRILKQFAN